MSKFITLEVFFACTSLLSFLAFLTLFATILLLASATFAASGSLYGLLLGFFLSQDLLENLLKILIVVHLLQKLFLTFNVCDLELPRVHPDVPQWKFAIFEFVFGFSDSFIDIDHVFGACRYHVTQPF